MNCGELRYHGRAGPNRPFWTELAKLMNNGVETTSEETKVLGFRAAANLVIHFHNDK